MNSKVYFSKLTRVCRPVGQKHLYLAIVVFDWLGSALPQFSNLTPPKMM